MFDVDAMPERLAAFLTARAEGRSATVTAYEPMTGGYSRLMARGDVTWSDGTTQQVVLRGDPPPGQAMMETDRDAEWALLQALGSVPELGLCRGLAYDASGAELGTKAIVLEYCAGASLQVGLAAITDGDHGNHPADLITTAASVHSVTAADLAGVLAEPPSWDEHIGSLIDIYRRAEHEHVESDPFLRFTAAWLDANRPAPLPLRLVHGDFQAANIMTEPGTGRHLLIDWELAHIGDPREDLGYYNIYSSASGPNLFAADPEGFLARYREATGFSTEAVNLETMGYFSALASITVFSRILAGAGAMALGANSGIMTTYTINALTVGHSNWMANCVGGKVA